MTRICTKQSYQDCGHPGVLARLAPVTRVSCSSVLPHSSSIQIDVLETLVSVNIVVPEVAQFFVYHLSIQISNQESA